MGQGRYAGRGSQADAVQERHHGRNLRDRVDPAVVRRAERPADDAASVQQSARVVREPSPSPLSREGEQKHTIPYSSLITPPRVAIIVTITGIPVGPACPVIAASGI